MNKKSVRVKSVTHEANAIDILAAVTVKPQIRQVVREIVISQSSVA